MSISVLSPTFIPQTLFFSTFFLVIKESFHSSPLKGLFTPRLNDDHIVQLVHGLIISQVRYMLPVYSKIRFTEIDPVHSDMYDIQKTINAAMRLANRVVIKDRVSIEILQQNTLIPSINQLAVETTLMECWRCLNFDLPCGSLFSLPPLLFI